MNKKLDFLRDEQSRDKHPDREQAGGPADRAAATDHAAQAGATVPHGEKGQNAHNKVGNTAPTQTHQGQRTTQSRHDRMTMGAGPQNQVSARKGGGGAGRTPRGAG